FGHKLAGGLLANVHHIKDEPRNVLDFGTLPKGGCSELTFWLHNATGDALEAASLRSSCECFKVVLETQQIPPGGVVLARASVDFSDDPQFSGRMRMTAIASGANPGSAGVYDNLCITLRGGGGVARLLQLAGVARSR